MRQFLLQITAGIVGLFLVTKFVPGVSLKIVPGQTNLLGIEFTAPWQILLISGFGLGLINSFIKPILNFITFPLRILTFGLFSLIINMAMVEFIDILFPELIIQGIIPLFWTTIIVWTLSLICKITYHLPKS